MTWIDVLKNTLTVPVCKEHRDGTHRIASPAATLARVQPLLRKLEITRVANVTGLDYIGIPVVMVTRPNSRALAVSQGKGISLDHARVSGVMEAIETWHGERIDLPLKLASLVEMRRRHAIVDTTALARQSDSRFRDDLRLLWIEGYDLMSRSPVWLPYECVHVDYTLPLPEGSGCFQMSSNGLASGNHLLEALIAGICEVVERDADALWEAMTEEEATARRIDLASIDDPAAKDVLARYAVAGMTVVLWETTSDIGVPAFRCHICENGDNPYEPLGIFFGAGCHPARAVALLRALTEAAQSRLTYIAGSRDDVEYHHYRRPGGERPAERFRAIVGEQAATRSWRQAPDRQGEWLNEDLSWLLESLAAVGIHQVVAVDLSQAAIGIPVVRVVIPGLEGVPDDMGYVPGERVRVRRGGSK